MTNVNVDRLRDRFALDVYKRQQEALLRAIDEATVLALQYEREMSEEAQNQMVNEFGVTLYEIDKAPIMERTQEIFSQFGEENGLSDMIARIQAE